MEDFVGTPNCPHLGFDTQGGRPCCHADDSTRMACGKFAPNPAARKAGAAGNIGGIEPWFCTVLGTDALPPEALRLAALEKSKARQDAAAKSGYRPPPGVSGQLAGRPDREDHSAEEPTIPTHTIRAEGRQIAPNERCPCGSGKKYKKCCGRA